MKSITLLLALLAFCRVSDGATIEWKSWGECKTLARADHKCIVALFCSDNCLPCLKQKAAIENLVRTGRLGNCHFALVDAVRSRELFDSLRDPNSEGVPQLLVSDLIRHKVKVGFHSEEFTLAWLTGRAK